MYVFNPCGRKPKREDNFPVQTIILNGFCELLNRFGRIKSEQKILLKTIFFAPGNQNTPLATGAHQIKWRGCASQNAFRIILGHQLFTETPKMEY